MITPEETAELERLLADKDARIAKLEARLAVVEGRLGIWSGEGLPPTPGKWNGTYYGLIIDNNAQGCGFGGDFGERYMSQAAWDKLRAARLADPSPNAGGGGAE